MRFQILKPVVTLLATLAVTTLHAQVATIEKPARSQNPTMTITSWQGPDAIRKALLNDLLYSDWFTVIEGSKGDYRLTAVGEGGDTPSLRFTITSADGATVSNRHAKGTGDAWKWMVHRAVDQMIEDTFKNPGPCASRIAYSLVKGDTQEIWLCDFDGSDPVQMTHNRSLSVEPSWSHDNRYMLYTLYERIRTSIIMVDLQNRRHRRLSSASGLNAGAAFSPDGTQVAMTLSRDNVVDLYVFDMKTEQLRRLTEGRAVEASPTFSPDSRTICYVTDEHSARPTLFLKSAAGGRPQQLLSTPIEAVSPDWSPLSNKIVFAKRAGSGYTIAMIDVGPQGSREIQDLIDVNKHPGNWEAPSWMADGRHIVCTRDHRGKKLLYMVDTWYGTIRQLHQQPGDALLPAASSRY